MASELAITKFIADLQAFYDKDYSEVQARLLERSFNGQDVLDEIFDQVSNRLFLSLKWLPKPIEIIQAYRDVVQLQAGSPYKVADIGKRKYAIDELGVIYFGKPRS